MVVTGTTTVNGVISVLGRTGSWTGGAGGSVFLTTGLLTGNGTIQANGAPSLMATGGGGRIAVILTNSTDFGNVKMQAYPGGSGSTPGAAGTVYLETSAQGAGQGMLVIDASNLVTIFPTTLISSNVTDTVVGTVVITNKAVFQIDTNQSLTVNGSWLNYGTNASFIAYSNSTVTFAGANEATVVGSNTFFNLTCTNAGKTMRFTAGSTNWVNGRLALGSGKTSCGVTLKSTADGSYWYLTLSTNGTQQIGAVTVKDSNAGGGQTLNAGYGSVDAKHNVNWTFPPAGTILSVR